MEIIDVGHGAPLVLIPGIQGRWEWMRPAVEALAGRCRVIAFSLADEPTSGFPFDSGDSLGSYLRQIEAAMDARNVANAAICGVSYGGLIASAFAARQPQRTSSLVLVSAMPPSWSPDRRVAFYLRAPRLLSPLFCLASLRLHSEIAAAHDSTLDGIGASVRHALNAIRHPFSPRRMASRVRALGSVELSAEIRSVRCPVLIVTGDAALERVMPVRRTMEYAQLIPHARIATLHRTGHLGLITRPAAFAAIVAPFVTNSSGAGQRPATDSRRRIG
jgi:pimeloyl-ACP methyl ester carboxylesterase